MNEKGGRAYWSVLIEYKNTNDFQLESTTSRAAHSAQLL